MGRAAARKQVLDGVLAEHKQLNRELAALDDWASEDTPRTNGWATELSRRAATAVEHLKKHFGGSAEGDMFQDFLKRSPHLADKLTALTAEHSVIVNELREVAEKAARADGKDSERLALKARAAVALLRRHEAEENELIFRSAYDDLCDGD